MKLLLTFTYSTSLVDWKKGGIISREVALYKNLLRKNVDITFITYGNENDLKFSNMLGEIKVIPCSNYIKTKIPKYTFLKTFIIPIKLKNIFRNTDIIKTNQIKGSWIAIIAKLFYKKKIIVRGGYEWLDRHIRLNKKKGLINYLKYLINYAWIFINELFAYKLADGIILSSKEDITFIINNFRLKRKTKKNKICHFYNFIETDLFKPMELPKKKNHILFIGRLTKQKNLDNLLYVFKDLKEFTLDIIGDGPYENKLKKIAKDLEIKVNFLGIFPNEKIPEILNKYEIFILPSYWEGNPKVLLEAMSCGVCCIGSNIKGINTIIKHKENGFLCNFSSNSIKEAILTLNKDNNLRETIGKKARQFILNECSLSSIAGKEYLFYKQILREHN